MAEVVDFLTQVAQGKAADAKQSLGDMLSTRAFQALSDRKQEIAQTLYNGQTADEVNGVTEPVEVETDEVQAQTEVEEPEQVEEPKEEE